MLPKPCKCKGAQEKSCAKTEIKIDLKMLPLSDVSFNGKHFCEVRKLPKKIREGVIASLEVLSGEGYRTIEYIGTEKELVLHDERNSYHCTFAYKFLVKKSYLDLLCAVEMLHAHLEQKSKQTPRTRTAK